MKKIFIGKIVNTFGIKGELKIVSRFEMPRKAFILGQKIMINEINHEITSVRFHKGNILVEIDGIKDINQVEKYIGEYIYIDYDNLKLNPDEYLYSDLMDMNVYNNAKIIGKVTDYDNNQLNPLIKVNNQFFIPIKANFIIKIDKSNNNIMCQNLEGLMK